MDEDGRFSRWFIMFGDMVASAHVSARPFSSSDMGHIKHPKIDKGVLAMGMWKYGYV